MNKQQSQSSVVQKIDEQLFDEFPPGYRFKPKDEELIIYYLLIKVKNKKLPPNRINEVELYHHNPETLAENYVSYGEKEWYFFTPRDRKYRNGERPNRAAGDGYWKATGADKPIHYNGVPVGSRKALVFYKGKPPRGDKTDWIMHEYKVADPPKRARTGNDMRLDDWVLCRIYKKADRPARGPKQRGNADAGSVQPQESASSVDQPQNNSATVEPRRVVSQSDMVANHVAGNEQAPSITSTFNAYQCSSLPQLPHSCFSAPTKQAHVYEHQHKNIIPVFDHNHTSISNSMKHEGLHEFHPDDDAFESLSGLENYPSSSPYSASFDHFLNLDNTFPPNPLIFPSFEDDKFHL